MRTRPAPPDGAHTTDVAAPPPDGRAEALAFLRAVYGAALDGALVELRPLRGGKPLAQTWHPATADGFAALADRALALAADGADCYTGAALRSRAGGTAGDVGAVTALWADLDCGPGKPHADPAAALDALDALGPDLSPSIRVASGGGVHAWWLLSEAAAVGELLDAHGRIDLVARLAAVLRGDNVGDPPRIMRLPGTWNVKRAAPVRLLACDRARRYHVPDLLDLLPPATPPAAARAAARWHGAPAKLGDLAPRVRRVVEALGTATRAVPGGLRLADCPACHAIGDDAGKAWITLAGRLRDWRSTCPAAGDGLPLGEWTARYAPEVLPALARPTATPDLPAIALAEADGKLRGSMLAAIAWTVPE